MVIVKKDYVNLKDTSKKAAALQPAVKSWESRVPQHINTAHHNSSQSSTHIFSQMGQSMQKHLYGA